MTDLTEEQYKALREKQRMGLPLTVEEKDAMDRYEQQHHKGRGAELWERFEEAERRRERDRDRGYGRGL